MNEFEQMRRDPVSRRIFLARMSAAGLGAVALGLFAGCGGSSNSATGIPGAASFPGVPGRNINEIVLNYALTLENLEADLYRQALNRAAGKPLTDPLAANQATYTQSSGNGGLAGPLASAGFLYLVQYAYVEAAHRDFLRAAIQAGGGTPVAPNANGYRFATPLGNDMQNILSAILPLEETGVRAYLGAAPFLTDLGLATTATSIYSTEARHSAAISYILGLDPGPRMQPGDKKVTPNYPSENTFEYYLDPATVITNIQPLLVP